MHTSRQGWRVQYSPPDRHLLLLACEDLHRLAVMTAITSTPDVQATRRTLNQDRPKAANIICWPNIGQADVVAEAQIKGLPTNSRLRFLNARNRRKPLDWDFRPNVGLTDVGPVIVFAAFRPS